MATDINSFLIRSKHAKKASTNHKEHKELVNLTETSVCIIFKKPAKNGTEINVTATIKHLFTTMKSTDLLLTKYLPLTTKCPFD